ncbi:hypothetical protein T11_6266 [Trichinella zimbabwensis]|uniref:Uncharacterized protein n=1 Tax=Trichinella zimbabwensis TaxID=268475 RepID=A0A0V1GGP2_9BILA|nr:hypothetical protein T11_6266 [Trichinella zimbabwensis]
MFPVQDCINYNSWLQQRFSYCSTVRTNNTWHSKKTKNCFDCEYKKHSIAIFAICSSEIELILQQDSRGNNMRLII